MFSYMPAPCHKAYSDFYAVPKIFVYDETSPHQTFLPYSILTFFQTVNQIVLVTVLRVHRCQMM